MNTPPPITPLEFMENNQNREPLKEQPLPNEYIPKDILDLQETIRLMVYAPLEERQRLAWKFVGPFNPIPVIPTPAKSAHTKLIAAAPETAAECDRLRARLKSQETVWANRLSSALRDRDQAQEQVKTLLAKCKAVHAMLSQPVAFSDESANDQKSLEILRGDCFAARQQLHAASVEIEGVK